MRYTDEARRERDRQLDLINMVPSNKFDVPNYNNLSQEQMDEFEKRHLQELADQTRKYDINEQQVVAENLDPFILYNALGDWMTSAREMMERGASIFQQGGGDGNL